MSANRFQCDEPILVGMGINPEFLRPLSRKQVKKLRRDRKLYSANLVVDIGGATQMSQSLPLQASLSPSGQMCGLSGVFIGQPVDMINADTYCNLYAMGIAVLASGPLVLQVQTSDSDTSGTYTDPTSGLGAGNFPTSFQSGGLLVINSGSTGGILGAQTSGQSVQSGWAQAAAFIRNGRFARINFLSGFYIGSLQAGFISQLKTTGSGGGYTLAPSSGVVNV